MNTTPDTSTDTHQGASTDTSADRSPGLSVVRPDTTPDTGADATPDTGADATPDTSTDTGADTSTDTAADGGSDLVPLTGVVVSGGSGVRVSGSVVPLVPSWLTDRQALTGLVREKATRGWRWVAFHGLRLLPVYWPRIARYAPRGLARVARCVWDWVTDTRTRTVLRGLSTLASIGAQEGTAYRNVQETWRERVRLRLIVTGVATAVVSAGCVVAVLGMSAPVRLLAAAVTVTVLGWIGRPADAAPVVSSVTLVDGMPPRLDMALIVSALDTIGNARLSRGLKAEGLPQVTPIHRDGPGWRVDVDLPGGVPATEVIAFRDRLAAGLRRPLACVWPEADGDAHEARLRLWVGDKAPSKTKPAPWVLAERGSVDLFEPFPIGTDPRGRQVTMTLMFVSALLGGQPRMGKSFTLRLVLLAAALDVRAELHTYDLKGGSDLNSLGPVSHRFRTGDADDDIAYLAEDVAALIPDMSRRYKVIRGLPESICPEGKVTPALAARRDLGLHPVVLAIDETQYAFEHPTYGKQLEADITDLVKRGPAVGIIVILATQRPDAKSVPTGISANAIMRCCLRVANQQANDIVLGTGMYKAGINAAGFARSEKGVAYLLGEGDDPQIVRSAYLDATKAKVIAARARAARIVAGTLTGYAADLDATPDETEDGPTLLDDLAAVMQPSEPKVWGEDLIARLIDLRPATYDGWTPADLGQAATAYGVRSVQIGRRDDTGKVVNRRGIALPDVLTALADRRPATDTDPTPDPGTATGTATDGDDTKAA